jgi:hypothetical protein
VGKALCFRVGPMAHRPPPSPACLLLPSIIQHRSKASRSISKSEIWDGAHAKYGGIRQAKPPGGIPAAHPVSAAPTRGVQHVSGDAARTRDGWSLSSFSDPLFRGLLWRTPASYRVQRNSQEENSRVSN